MYIEFIVEEPSAEIALHNLLPMVLGDRATFKIISLGGKPSVLRKLRNRLRGYKHFLSIENRLVILVDRDNDDCKVIKLELENAAADVSLLTKSAAKGDDIFLVLNRIAIEELEAWFLGDVTALTTAYPRVPPSLGKRQRFRDPDAVPGGTWEALERVLQAAGYHKGGLRKREVARMVSQYMNPDENRSKSFRNFVIGVNALLHNQT